MLYLRCALALLIVSFLTQVVSQVLGPIGGLLLLATCWWLVARYSHRDDSAR